MKTLNWRTALCAMAMGLFAALPARAEIVTFEDVTPTLFGPGDSFLSLGYLFGVDYGAAIPLLGLPPGFALGFGMVDTAAGLSNFSNAPTGNATQFFAGLNDAALTLRPTIGQTLNVRSFDFGFVPPVVVPNSASPGALAAIWVDVGGNTGFSAFDFGAADANGDWAFGSSNSRPLVGGTALPELVRSMTFLACFYDGNNCVVPLNQGLFANQAQFAIDNINVSVPIPGTLLLVFAGIAAVGAARRRTIG